MKVSLQQAAKDREDLVQQHETLLLKVKSEHQVHVEEIKSTHAQELDKLQQQILLLERQLEDARFQNAIRDAYFKKREVSLLKDYDSKVNGPIYVRDSQPLLSCKVALVQSMNDGDRERYQSEMSQLRMQLDDREHALQTKETHILELNNKIAALKLDVQNLLMQAEKNVAMFEKKGQHILEKVSERWVLLFSWNNVAFTRAKRKTEFKASTACSGKGIEGSFGYH